MSSRIATIDILRGLAITGMVLCSGIGFDSGLPGWMFHAQTPPPTYAFDPSNAGITWVDLVFPFFLFSMGAAFPFALTKRLNNGAGFLEITGILLKRWLILSIFGLVLANVYSIWGTEKAGWQTNLYHIGIWAALFLSLVRSEKKWVNPVGYILLCILLAAQIFWFNIPLDKDRCDVIIMILANTALFGGAIWALTRKSLKTRWLVILLIASIKAVSSYAPQAIEFIPSIRPVEWFFKWEWLQYLIIVLTGSVVGDIILQHKNKPAVVENKGIWAAGLALAAIPLQLWGLYTRNVVADMAATAIVAAIFFILTRKDTSGPSTIGKIGFALLIMGIIFDPIDGGIAKEYCNLSYLFATSGMASLATCFILTMENRFGYKGVFIGGIGQNPMLAYVIVNLLIFPILRLTGLFQVILDAAIGSPFMGMIQGLIFTALMMAGTFAFTKLKLFWRS